MKDPEKPTDSFVFTGSGVLPSRLGRYVRLNVGGRLFYTTVDTLTKKDTMLRAMFSGEVAVLTDEEGTSVA